MDENQDKGHRQKQGHWHRSKQGLGTGPEGGKIIIKLGKGPKKGKTWARIRTWSMYCTGTQCLIFSRKIKSWTFLSLTRRPFPGYPSIQLIQPIQTNYQELNHFHLAFYSPPTLILFTWPNTHIVPLPVPTVHTRTQRLLRRWQCTLYVCSYSSIPNTSDSNKDK